MFDEKWERRSFKDNNPAPPQHSVGTIRLLVAMSFFCFIRSIRSTALRSDTNRGHKKTSHSCLLGGPEIALREYEERKRITRFSAKYRSRKFLRFLATTALQRYKFSLADFSALAPARRVRFPMGREPPQGAVTPALC